MKVEALFAWRCFPAWNAAIQPAKFIKIESEPLLHAGPHDGWSNAERLQGLTGDEYLVEYSDRRLLLDRHLASFSSSYNNNRMIRIYYTYDKISRRVIVGYMPGHLGTRKF